MQHTKCLIVGSGPAGYTAAIYASRAALEPILYEGIMPGGQLTTTTEIDNFPGYPSGTTGTALMEDLCAQAKRFGTEVRTGVVTRIDTTVRPFVVHVEGQPTLTADTVVLSTGATAKYLGLESEEKFRGMGVSACATCDGFFYRKKVVAVVGGGDTACEEASYLAGLASKVYLIVRKDHLRASKAMQDRVFANEKIQVLFGYHTQEVLGDEGGVTGVRIMDSGGLARDLSIDGFFLAIGHHPNTELVSGVVDLDEAGYILTRGGSPCTNIAGLFAAGDVQDPHYRQAITAAGSGCSAALEAERYLAARGGGGIAPF